MRTAWGIGLVIGMLLATLMSWSYVNEAVRAAQEKPTVEEILEDLKGVKEVEREE